MIPEWVDRQEYPFTPRTLEVPAGRLSYVDEGQGDPIVMVHGTPTWSFLYRHLIKALRDRYRCVAPDHLGFGLSDRPVSWSYRPEDQARNLGRLIEALGLEDLTLVVHDFGGPIGLAYALDHPENVRRLVLFNTWMWSCAGDRHFELFGRLLSGKLGRYLYERWSFSVRVMLRHSIADRRRYTRAVERHYLRPLDGHATWVYARELLGSSAWFDGLWRRRDRIAQIPTLVCWGMRDPAFGRYLERWREVFERAAVIELSDCGHAPPEERAPEVLAILVPFLAEAGRERAEGSQR